MKKKTTVILCVILAVLVVAAFVLVPSIKGKTPQTPENPNEKTITFIVINGDDTKDFTIKTEKETLGDALKDEKLVEGTEGQYGLFVTSVNGIQADSSKQEWWSFSKNGESLSVGIDSTPIAQGDTFEATLMIGW